MAMTSKQLKALSRTPEELGFCMLCGGVNGNCSCGSHVGGPLPEYKRRTVYDFRSSAKKEGQTVNGSGRKDYGVHFLCFRCGSLLALDDYIDVITCECGNHVRYIQEYKLIEPEPDNSWRDISELPRRALRKPSLRKPRI